MARSMTARSSAGHRCARFENDDAGFTLMESLVAFVLFVVISTTVTWGIMKSAQITGISRDRTAAAQLAAQEIDRMRSQNALGQVVDNAATTVTLKGITYTVTPTATPAMTAACATGASRAVSVIVSWGTPQRSTRFDTELAC